jgi:hypothetical protein
VTSVWKRLRSLFDTDDGSLPTVRLTGLSSQGLAAVYAFLRARARVSPAATFWHRSLERDELLSSWPNSALLVVADEADSFHFLASGMAFGDVVLPDLGVFISRDEVVLDYQMGPEWDERRVLALFELLRQLTALDSQARVRLHRHMLPRVEQKFLDAFSDYCRQRIA